MFLHRNIVIASFFAMLAAVLSMSLKVLFFAHGILLLTCLIDVFSAPSPKSLNFQRSGKTSGKLNNLLTHKLTIKNCKNRKIRGWIRDCWPPSAGLKNNTFSFTLNSGAEIDFPEEFLPYRRGTRNSQFIAVRTLGIFHLAGRQHSFPTNWQLKILPPFISQKHLPSRIIRLREMEGRALLLVRGAGTEFDSLREYVAGDDVRAIDWRSSARLGQTLVRTWRPERDRRIVVLLDCGRAGAMRVGDFPAFDDYIETALLLASLAQRAGDSIEVYALDTSIRTKIKVSANEIGINQIAVALADVNPILTITDWQLAVTQINRQANNAALVVVLTDIGFTSISTGLLQLIKKLTKKHQVLVASAHNSQLLTPIDAIDAKIPQRNDVHLAVAQARAQLERTGINKQLTQFGATVISADPKNLPLKVADTYLELKASGKL